LRRYSVKERWLDAENWSRILYSHKNWSDLKQNGTENRQKLKCFIERTFERLTVVFGRLDLDNFKIKTLYKSKFELINSHSWRIKVSEAIHENIHNERDIAGLEVGSRIVYWN